jgi:hypothetical protein
VDAAVSDRVAEKITSATAALTDLGPVNELSRDIENIFQKSLPNVRAAVSESKRLREKLLNLLDQPKCGYDDRCFELYTTLASIDIDERPHARRILNGADRKALSLYPGRADWLALEEKSAARLRSGLVIQAFTLDDHSDYRDVMCMVAATHVIAHKLGVDAAPLFAEAATFSADGVRDTLIEFGKRSDVTLAAFGVNELETPTGIRFRPSM